MNLDSYDLRILDEMYEVDLIKKLNQENVNKIYTYLVDKGIYYAKDLFINYLELFLIDSEEFTCKFDKLIDKLGDNYIDMIGEDSSLLDELYGI